MNFKLVTILGLMSTLLTTSVQAEEIKTVVCKSQDFIYKLQKKDDGNYWVYASGWPVSEANYSFNSQWQYCELESQNSKLNQVVCASTSTGKLPDLGARITLFKNGRHYSFKQRLFIEGHDSSNWERVSPSQVVRWNRDIADGLACEVNAPLISNNELMKVD